MQVEVLCVRFDGFLGNTALKQRLDAAFSSGKVSHCYALCGPVGSGKHTLAKIMAAAMQCTAPNAPCGVCNSCRKVFSGNHPDVITVDDTEHVSVSVDVARAARSDVFERPNEGLKKIYVIPRGDALGIPSQNTLLKILEEPPDYAVFLILTANEGALLDTVRSRCVSLHLAPLSYEEAAAALRARFPQADESTLRAAHSRSGGFFGQMVTMLEGSVWDENTLRFAEYYQKNDRLALLELMIELEKQKRPALQALMWQWHALLAQALEAKFGAPADERAQAIAASHTSMQLSRSIQYVKKAAETLALNAAVGTVLGWLLSRL